MQQTKMSTFFLACLLFAMLLAGAEAKEKQIKLEDIERDNLAAERHAKQTKQQQYQQQPFGYQPTSQLHSSGNHYLSNTAHVHIPNVVKTQNFQKHQNGHQFYQHQGSQGSQGSQVTFPLKMQYGFVPITPTQPPQQVRYQYVPSYAHPEAYLPQVQSVASTAEKQLQTPRVHYTVHPLPKEEKNSQHQHRYAGFTVPLQTQAYQQYFYSAQGQTHSTPQHQPQTQTQIQYIPESQLQQYTQSQHQNQPQSHYQPPHIQYVVDNSIQTEPQDSQKYYQQYVYIQPYQTPSASNNVHSISDTKGNVQYVMYIPAGAAYPGETFLAYNTNQETQYVYQPVLDQAPQANIKPLGATGHTHSSHPSEEPTSGVTHTIATPKQIERPVFKHEATSLLDSYVPSYLQIQYYKQQQADKANVIKQSLKVGGVQDVGKTDVVKSHKEGTSY